MTTSPLPDSYLDISKREEKPLEVALFWAIKKPLPVKYSEILPNAANK
jgi:hypothetical protein